MIIHQLFLYSSLILSWDPVSSFDLRTGYRNNWCITSNYPSALFLVCVARKTKMYSISSIDVQHWTQKETIKWPSHPTCITLERKRRKSWLLWLKPYSIYHRPVLADRNHPPNCKWFMPQDVLKETLHVKHQFTLLQRDVLLSYGYTNIYE